MFLSASVIRPRTINLFNIWGVIPGDLQELVIEVVVLHEKSINANNKLKMIELFITTIYAITN
jgi:hypothetical protein